MKPPLLVGEPRDDGKLWLHSYRFARSAYAGDDQAGNRTPEGAAGLRNASPELRLDFTEICPSPTFPAAPITAIFAIVRSSGMNSLV